MKKPCQATSLVDVREEMLASSIPKVAEPGEIKRKTATSHIIFVTPRKKGAITKKKGISRAFLFETHLCKITLMEAA